MRDVADLFDFSARGYAPKQETGRWLNNRAENWTSISLRGYRPFSVRHTLFYSFLLASSIGSSSGNGSADLLAFFARHPDLFDWQRPDGSCMAFPHSVNSAITCFTVAAKVRNDGLYRGMETSRRV